MEMKKYIFYFNKIKCKIKIIELLIDKLWLVSGLNKILFCFIVFYEVILEKFWEIKFLFVCVWFNLNFRIIRLLIKKIFIVVGVII